MDICEQNKKSLAKICGQVGGIKKMYEDNREAEEILIQILAAKAALSKLGSDILDEEASNCIKIKNPKKKKDTFDKLVKMVFKLT
jgi:DNA-binding FrmR family transcriptional regulator